MESMVKIPLTYQYLSEYYKDKNVFVTGHTGFKGSWLIKILNDLGAVVKGYALSPENDLCLYNAMNGDVICNSIIGDIRDFEKLKKVVADFQPDFIFHLAAQPLVRKSYEFPVETFEINALGTTYLLEAIKTFDKRCSVVLITTDKVYQNKEIDYHYQESDCLGGYDPYSASKACCELIIDSYRNSFFNVSDYAKHKKAIGVARAGNVIGGGDWSTDRLIPDVIKALQSNTDVIIRNQSSIRPWQHVIEPLFGYLELGARLLIDPTHFGQAFNFGPNPNDNLSVEEVVIKSINFWKSGKYRLQEAKEKLHEAGLLKLDISKTLNQFNWKPIFDSSAAIQRTITWYKSYYSGIPVIDLMKSDIEFYHKLSYEKNLIPMNNKFK